MFGLNERYKYDIGMVGQSISNTNVTGRYFSMKGVRRVMALVIGGAAAITKTLALEFLQATDGEATGAKSVASSIATGTANTLATSVNVALASTSTADLVVINGVTYTQASGTTVADREFLNAAGLVLCVNNATYGVTGVTALASTTNVILTSDDAGAVVLTVVSTDVGGTIVTATLEAIAFIECRSGDLDIDNGFDHVAVKVTSTGVGIDCVLLIREMSDRAVTQKVAASTVLKAT